jgi:hypothetical protein
MKKKKKKKGCELLAEDESRLRRLAEEIDGRTAELSRILARQLEVSPPGPLVEYKLQALPASNTDIVVRMHEVTFTDGSKLCHDGEQRVTCAGPCPC